MGSFGAICGLKLKRFSVRAPVHSPLSPTTTLPPGQEHTGQIDQHFAQLSLL